MKPQISVMIRAYNEQRLIGSALEYTIEHLKKSKIESEILVGVQGNDNTLKIASSFKKKFKNLRIFKREPDVIEITKFLIDKANSDIIVAADADNLFIGDVKRVVKIFRDPKVGGIVGFDLAIREWMNKGVEVFEKTYGDVKIKHHTKGNLATDPIMCINIYRKSALKKPYVETLNDDTELTHKLLSRNYKVIYDKKLRYYLMNNPLQPQVTAKAVFRRRMRSEKFRDEAKTMLNTNRFEAKERVGEFMEAIALAVSKMDIREFLGFAEYMAIISAATAIGRLKTAFGDREFIKRSYMRAGGA